MQAKSLARLLAKAAVVEYVYCDRTERIVLRPAGDKYRTTQRRVWAN